MEIRSERLRRWRVVDEPRLNQKTELAAFSSDPSGCGLHHAFMMNGKPSPPHPHPGCMVHYSSIFYILPCGIIPVTNFSMGKEYQFATSIPLSELAQKAETLEKLSRERSALAKRVGIDGKVKAHSSLETAQRIGRVRAKLELSAEIFSLKAIALRNELEAYEKAPGIMAEWQRRGEEFMTLSAEHYRGKVGKTKFTKAYREYKEYAERIERHLPTMRAIERRRHETWGGQVSQ